MKENVWTVILMLISTGVASIGGYVGLSQYMAARPSVFVDVADVIVVAGEPSWQASLLARLELIEETHIAYTGFEIVGLVQRLSEWQDDANVPLTELKNELLTRLADAIGIFEEQESDFENLAGRLQSVADNLDRSGFGREALIAELSELERQSGKVTGYHITSLTDDLRQQSDTEFEVGGQKAGLSDLVRTFRDSRLNVLSIVSDLKRVRGDVRESKR